ncbi:hypothetical protein HYPSUDRAFT_72945 [Hypholoma sublateritium FD-334 SS-4]|uniref:MSP domain-containing protein n=1 Tax=Hypholoma sublateritium (strain FD-334 SS-4) TaxID=945553 RepID=A0A0D2LS72_HYPSF|nr:hypothetical protein HYPSUDRAFT_72945 [Hypholoma sublateritium FD-334 SS-4]
MNINTYPVAFRIKTSKPELYYAHPFYGRVEPGQDVNVTIQSMPLPEDPPLDKKCRHKFVVEIVAITPERLESLTPHEFFKTARENNKTEIHKFRVAYIPAEGLDPDETAHYAAGMAHSIVEDLFEQEESSELTPRLHQYTLPEVDLQSASRVGNASANSSSGSKAHLAAAPAEFVVALYPCHALYFQRPLTRPISRSLMIANANSYPIVFKIETKTPQVCRC